MFGFVGRRVGEGEKGEELGSLRLMPMVIILFLFFVNAITAFHRRER